MRLKNGRFEPTLSSIGKRAFSVNINLKEVLCLYIMMFGPPGIRKNHIGQNSRHGDGISFFPVLVGGPKDATALEGVLAELPCDGLSSRFQL